MSLALTPEQELIQRVVRDFAKKDLGADAAPMDREQKFRREHIEVMAPLGLLGMLLPEDAGGAGTDTLSYVLALEEVARVSGTDAVVMAYTNSLVSSMLHASASQEHKKKILEPVLAGKAMASVAVAEEAVGSSTDMMVTRLVADGDSGLRLRGSKTFVGLAPMADVILVVAGGPEGPTFIAVPKDAEGLHLGAKESKLGLRGLPLTDIYLNQVKVTKSQIVGEPGKALEMLTEPLNLMRLGVAAILVGLTQACVDSMIDFAGERRQFGQPIARFGAVRGMIADVQAELEAARATTYGGAALRDARKDYVEEVFEARLLANRIAVRGSRIAHKVHGGAGFMRDLPLERYSRDIRTVMHLWDAEDIARSRLAATLLD